MRKTQEKILSGIVKFYNTEEYLQISEIMNKNLFDKDYHSVLEDLIIYDCIDIQKYNFKYDPDITIEQTLYYKDMLKKEREKESLKQIKLKFKNATEYSELSSILQEIKEDDTSSVEDIDNFKISNILNENIDYLYSFKGKGTLGSQFGIETLDEESEGVFGLVGLTGTPGSGKTTLAIQAAWYNAFILKKPVLYITLEVSKKLFIAKFVSFLTAIPMKKILKEHLNKEETEKVNKAYKEILDNENLYIMDNKDGASFLNITRYIKSIKKKVKEETGFDENIFVVLDYLNLFHDYGKDNNSKMEKNDKVSSQMVEFIEIKNNTGTNFLLIAAKNKQGYDKAELASIKGSNDLEYAFETIISLEKPKENEQKIVEEINVYAKILKSRWGEAFISIGMFFDGAKSKFFDLKDVISKKEKENEAT